MKKTRITFLLGLTIGVFGFAFPAFAHESRTYEIGPATYTFVVGSLGEPVIVGDKTGIDLSISRFATPYTGAEASIKLETRSGEAKKTFELSPAYGAPGKYKTTLLITKSDPLSYRLVGTLEGKNIDLQFECSSAGHKMHSVEDKTRVAIADGITQTSKKGSFGCPAPKSDYQFPAAQEKSSFNGMPGHLPLVLGLFVLIFVLGALMYSRKNVTGSHTVHKQNAKKIAVYTLAGILVLLVGGYSLFCFNKKEKAVPTGHEAMMKMDGMEAMKHPMLEIDQTKPIPSLSIEVTPDSKDGYNIHLLTKNYKFTPQDVGGKATANEGHAHLYVNGVKVARLYGEWFNLSTGALKAGDNTIEVTLNANDHSEWVVLGKHIKATATVLK